MASSFKPANQEIYVSRRCSKEKQIEEQLSSRGRYSNGNTAAPVSSSSNTATVSGRMYVVTEEEKQNFSSAF